MNVRGHGTLRIIADGLDEGERHGNSVGCNRRRLDRVRESECFIRHDLYRRGNTPWSYFGAGKFCCSALWMGL